MDVDLDLEVMHGHRHEGRWTASGDPDSMSWLRTELHEWLTGKRWKRPRWREFELVVRRRGRGTPVTKIRP